MMGVYAITNTINGKMYVGSARNINQRWQGHRHELRHNRHHAPHLQRAWNKYGESAFILQVLEIVKDVTKLRETEQRWIDFLAVYGTGEGYNAFPNATGGRLAGTHPSEATLLKLRASNHARGEANVNAKLTADDVRAICTRLNADESANSIAKDYGVSPSTIGAIQLGHTWTHITVGLLNPLHHGIRGGSRHGMSKLTEADAEDIKRRRLSGESRVSIAKDYGIGQNAVSRIVLGRRWAHLPIAHQNRNMKDNESNAAKLTADDVRIIVERLLQGESTYEIAEDYAVRPDAIYAISSGRTWKYLHLPSVPKRRVGRQPKLSEEDIDEIKRRVLSGDAQSVVASDYGVDPSTVSQIVTGKRRGHIS